jgi:hypothetical protein
MERPPISWICRISIVKMAKAVYMFNVIPIKIPRKFFTQIEKSILKFTEKHKRHQIAKEILSQKSNIGQIPLYLTSNDTAELYQ